MKKIIHYLWLIFLLICLLLSSVAAEKIKVGGFTIHYDQVLEGDSDFDGVNDRTSYYLQDVLVFSAYDTDGDGKQDMWFTYINGSQKSIAMRDTTGDGKPENVLTFGKDGEILNEEERLNLPWIWITVGVLAVIGLVVYFFSRKKSKKPVKKKEETSKKGLKKKKKDTLKNDKVKK